MFDIVPTGEILGATIEGLDLSQPLTDADFRGLLRALGRHGVLRFPRQSLDPAAHKAFASRFGTLEVNVAGSFQVEGHPEVMILSNIVEEGKPIGIADAGQDWHTDMSYSAVISLTNVLFALKVPHDEAGNPLGNTQFASMQAAYDDLPDAVKRRLEGATAEHDFNKFWEMMRREKGSTRPPLSEEQRRRKPPVHHPVVLTHPITGRKVLYANPGYTVRIDGWPQAESDEMLDVLFRHQLQEKYIYTHRWTEGDVLMWDNIGCLHNAIADYRADQPRYMRRCQVMADWIFEHPLAGAA
ncbi:taurine dioxygenase [Tistlia consotensis]|uniref:Taurine dioxygenase n=1 Tax=Tistlia consotensis USBA 355 TaxID=560819 RepID=A0A1Y6CD66_9PROT|nr:TauD/TfdA family dioxygenase [Tistlia consotensis]SMF55516.1 taurine dioxygenase [Tistlia consotensis USBA 355]SNR88573.1 taurine dioxygenase [Tistlia consotensis]